VSFVEKYLKGEALNLLQGLVRLEEVSAFATIIMASKDEYKSEYSEELTNFIKTPSVPAPAPESTEFGVRSTAVSIASSACPSRVLECFSA
jgi:hypothetical protein